MRALDWLFAPRCVGCGVVQTDRRSDPTPDPMCEPCSASLDEIGAAEPDGLVVPVPTHWRRRFRRGFDHTWLLALHACAAAGLPRPIPALRKLRASPPQSTLVAAERRTNLRGCFATRLPVTGRSIVLVDDVATTGATLSECARTLLDAGAARVVGVVLARSTSLPATSAPG
jgi:ComF family protein